MSRIMKRSFNLYNQLDKEELYLAYPNRKLICHLNAKNLNLEVRISGISSITFNIYECANNEKNDGFDDIDIGKYIYSNLNGWFRISDIRKEDNGLNPYLEITCYDLSIELTQTILTSFGSMGTEGDSQGGLDRYALYDPNDQPHSIAHIFMDKNLGWKFKYIDPEITTERRSFDNNSVNSYGFLTGEVSDAFDCVFVFDGNEKTISAYKVENLGKQVPFILSFRNLIKKTDISWNEDDIKTVLHVSGGNDATGTALSIAAVNPSGNNTIANFSYFYKDMSDELVAKLEEYSELADSSKGKIATATSQLKVLQDELLDLNNKMPSVESSTTWSEYGLVGLKAKASTYKENMSVLTDAIASDPVAQNQYNNYNSLWNAVTAEITVRQNQIATKENQIKTKQSEVQSYVVSIDEVLGEELCLELQPFIREDDFCDDSFIATESMTDNEILEMKQALYDHAVSELNRVCYPQFDMTIDSVNFMALFKYKDVVDQLELGDIVTVVLNDTTFMKARLLKMEFNWDNLKDFKLTFSSKKNLEDGYFTIIEIGRLAQRTANTISYNKSGWNQASKQANEAYYNTNLKDFLDLSKQQIQANATDQEVTIDNTGALFTKKDATEKLWITNRQILLFDEPVGTNLKEPKIAIGMIEVNQNGVVTKAYGIGASLLLGKIVIAENLYIQNKNNTLTMGADGFKAKALNGFSVQINPDDPNNIFNISKDDEKFFYIDADSKKLVFRGYAEIDEGKIGGWDIAKDKLSSGGVGMSSDTTPGAVSIWAGNENTAIAPYRVTNQGEFVSSKADISGKITADEGRIGGWDITKNGLRGSSAAGISGGWLNIGRGLLAANDDEVNFGDYMVSADGTGTLRSSNGLVNITDTMTAPNSPLKEFAKLTMGNDADSESTIISGAGDISTARYRCRQDYYFEDTWTEGMGALSMFKQIYNRLDAIRYSIQNMGGNVDWD